MPYRILALSGSQRARSMSTGLLRACRDLAPAHLAIELFEQHKDFPLFDPGRPDVPPGVRALQDAITQADALLIASPEYAHGVTGTIKNTLDWVVNHAPFADKPVVVLNPAYQSFHADDALKETLRTMSADLVLDACLRIPVIGSGTAPGAIAAVPRFVVTITTVLSALVAHLERRATAPRCTE